MPTRFLASVLAGCACTGSSYAEPAGRSHRFEPPDWAGFVLTAGLALGVYLYTLAPEVTLGFSGIFSTGGLYGGIAHPPGYPFATLYHWAMIHLLPWSNIAWRVAAASAVAAALACGLVALMTSSVVGQLILGLASGSTAALTSREQFGLRLVCGEAAGLALAFDGVFWNRAVIGDVTTLSLLLLCLVLCLLQRWSYTPKRRGYLYAAALVYGLALTNSQILLAVGPAIPFLVACGDARIGRDFLLFAVVLFVAGWVTAALGWFPFLAAHRAEGNLLFACFVVLGLVCTAAAAALVIRTGDAFTERKTVFLCTGFVLLGLMLYFYPALASMSNPPMNWAYPRTVAGWFHMISRGQYERIRPPAGIGELLNQTGMFLLMTWRQFGGLEMLLAAVPFLYFRRLPGRLRRAVLAVVLLFLCLVVVVLLVIRSDSSRSSWALVDIFFAPSHVLLSISMGCGLACLAVRWKSRANHDST